MVGNANAALHPVFFGGRENTQITPPAQVEGSVRLILPKIPPVPGSDGSGQPYNYHLGTN